MGQTLSHGVYLPAEGERNCYSGLASNWNLLDTAIGDIDGKASATHTHGNITNDGKVGTTANLPLITGTSGTITTGSFGNQANTFCEGNDSRLSDARTPVAHTHTKSDVTNLFNSANTWTGENTFSNAIYSLSLRVNNSAYESGTPSSNVFYNPLSIGGFVNNAWINSLSINSAIRTNGYNDFSIRVYSQTGNTLTGVVAETNADASIINFRPIANGTHNLGTSSYKWKSLNGINPGALSLPDLSVVQDIDTTGWVYNGTTLNSVLLNSGDTNVTKNGWLYIRTNNTVAGDRVAVRLKNVTAEDPTTIAGEIGFGHIEIFVPIVAGYQAYVFTNKAPTYIKFYPCLGNVPSGV